MTKTIEEDPRERDKPLPKTIIVVDLNTKKDIEGAIEINVVVVAVVVEATTTTKRGNENAVEKRAVIVSTKNGIASTVVTVKIVIIRKETRDRDIADAVQAALYKCGEKKIAKVIVKFVHF
jgi:glycerol-3-phosphate dehydrogenase